MGAEQASVHSLKSTLLAAVWARTTQPCVPESRGCSTLLGSTRALAASPAGLWMRSHACLPTGLGRNGFDFSQ